MWNAPNNNKRAKWAESALRHFNKMVGGDMENALHDLLCDLRHYCDQQEPMLDFAKIDKSAYGCYVEEVVEERKNMAWRKQQHGRGKRVLGPCRAFGWGMGDRFRGQFIKLSECLREICRDKP